MTHAAWTRLLDRFERELADSAEPAPWTPPDAPLPPELADRARAVLRRQRERMLRTEEELTRVRRHLDAVRHVPGQAVRPPAFLDVSA